MKIFNTLTRKKEEFVPIEEGKVRMYVCGPTVYNLIHIGNARPMIVFDTFRRYMTYKGYDVNYVSNFTDVDDKIIAKANEEGVTSEEISERYIAECKKDMADMNVLPATTHPLATKEIGGMIKLIRQLEEMGYAYNVNGTVYFRTRKDINYGKLSHKNLDDLRSGNRELKVTGEEQKEDPLDFVLWKPKKEGEPFWNSPWGQGRPGWHTECSVMAKKYLGDTIDIHAGGEDLIFPHHENEIAQSECANGVTFSNYWMHNGFLRIDNEKMSKSLGNFKTVREIGQLYDLQILRLFMLSAHYRSPVNFSAEIMDSSASALDRIRTAVSSLNYNMQQAAKNAQPAGIEARPVADKDTQTSAGGEAWPVADKDTQMPAGGDTSAPVGQKAGLVTGLAESEKKDGFTAEEQAKLEEMKAFRVQFETAMEDDLNTADALSAIFELVKFANVEGKETSSLPFLQALKNEIVTLCDILGLIVDVQEDELDEEIEKLIEERQAARKAKDFAKADQIRDELLARGIILEDTREGVKWKRA